MKAFYLSFFFSRRFYISLGTLAVLFVFAFFFQQLFLPAQALALLLAILVVSEILLLYPRHMKLFATRTTADRWSNGDENEVHLYLENKSPLTVTLDIIDELPYQFQIRDHAYHTRLAAGKEKKLTYKLRPAERGVYSFGNINVFAGAFTKLTRRRFRFEGGRQVAVYPSFIQLRKFELLAASNHLQLAGIKRVRRLGNTMEFDQIKDYVAGDDFRTVNWKATARAAKLMTNQYIEERAQHVYSLIDMGRVMKMPFDGLTLLDHSINASLVISNIAAHKEDRPGIITFSSKIHAVLPAEKKANQMHRILDMLYAQEANFAETDFEKLYAYVRHRLTQRSLLLLFTNFESILSLQRQLPYLRKLGQNHLLLVIFFENTELKKIAQAAAESTEEIYIKTIGEKFAFEKRLIVKELEHAGVYALLTPPAGLTINVINKYLEFKALGLI